MNNKGFTLLEVLIALTILAISFAGIFFLLNQSINLEIYAKEKRFVIEKGYEKVLTLIDYKNDLTDLVEQSNGKTINYSLTKNPTLMENILQCELNVKTKDSSITYYYYETQQ